MFTIKEERKKFTLDELIFEGAIFTDHGLKRLFQGYMVVVLLLTSAIAGIDLGILLGF